MTLTRVRVLVILYVSEGLWGLGLEEQGVYLCYPGSPWTADARSAAWSCSLGRTIISSGPHTTSRGVENIQIVG